MKRVLKLYKIPSNQAKNCKVIKQKDYAKFNNMFGAVPVKQLSFKRSTINQFKEFIDNTQSVPNKHALIQQKHFRNNESACMTKSLHKRKDRKDRKEKNQTNRSVIKNKEICS